MKAKRFILMLLVMLGSMTGACGQEMALADRRIIKPTDSAATPSHKSQSVFATYTPQTRQIVLNHAHFQ